MDFDQLIAYSKLLPPLALLGAALALTVIGFVGLARVLSALRNSQQEQSHLHMRDSEPSPRVVCQITITAVDEAEEPNMPSHFFPGCGSDRAEFRVTQGACPSKELMDKLLQEWDQDCYLGRYDSSSGIGSFTMLDCSAPAPGTVIPLEAHSTHTADELPLKGLTMIDTTARRSDSTARRALPARIAGLLIVGGAIFAAYYMGLTKGRHEGAQPILQTSERDEIKQAVARHMARQVLDMLDMEEPTMLSTEAATVTVRRNWAPGDTGCDVLASKLLVPGSEVLGTWVVSVDQCSLSRTPLDKADAS